MEPLLRFVLAKPFLPFDVYLSDGRSIRISHPEVISIAPLGAGLWVAWTTGQMEFVEGDAVVSLRSVGPADSSALIKE